MRKTALLCVLLCLVCLAAPFIGCAAPATEPVAADAADEREAVPAPAGEDGDGAKAVTAAPAPAPDTDGGNVVLGAILIGLGAAGVLGIILRFFPRESSVTPRDDDRV